MVSSSDILNAIRELANTKQLDKAELHGLLSDGIFAALAKSYGPTVQAEVEIDEGTGDVMEDEIDFAQFGRNAVQAAKQRIIQRVRERERTRIRDEFATRVGDLLSGEVQQIERGKLVIMLNKFREAKGSTAHPEPGRWAVREGAVQARGARDPAGHRRHPRGRARSRQSHQDRG